MTFCGIHRQRSNTLVHHYYYTITPPSNSLTDSTSGIMKFSTITLLCVFIAQLATAHPEPQSKRIEMSIYEAINKAGYQRMLTQRIAKSYLAIIGDIDAEAYKSHLKGCAKLFENNLKELSEYAPTDDIKAQFRYVGILWRNYQFIYSDEYSLENAEVILQFNDKILGACHKATVMLDDYAQTLSENKDQEMNEGSDRLSHIINISGRQRMLTQRLLLMTLASFQNIGDRAVLRQKFDSALSDFREAFKELMSYEGNTEEIDGQLFTITGLWDGVERSLIEIKDADEHSVQHKDALIKALKKSEQVLFGFDEVVFLYERIGG